MNHKELYNILKTVKKNIRCPQCGKPYDFKEIKIRGIAEQVIFLELSCTDHMPVLATVAYSGKTPRISEKKAPSLSTDDVLDAYHFFKDFSGGFKKIFRHKSNSKNNIKNKKND